MKNLILTFVFALVSLISISQSTMSINYVSGIQTGTVLHKDTIFCNSNILFDQTNIYFNAWVNYSDSLRTVTPVISSGVLSDEISVNIYDTLYLKVRNSNISTSYIWVTVIFTDPSASVSENTLTREELKAYPSPATSDIKISFQADKSDMLVNIFSLNGQLVYQDTQSREVGSITTLELNVSDWAAGIYLVNNGKETFKFVVL